MRSLVVRKGGRTGSRGWGRNLKCVVLSKATEYKIKQYQNCDGKEPLILIFCCRKCFILILVYKL